MKDCSRSICATDWFGAKNDIVGRLIGMAKIGAMHNPSSDNDDHADSISSIFCLTEDIKRVLKSLPEFSSVTEWGKQLNGVLMRVVLNQKIYGVMLFSHTCMPPQQ